MTLNLASPQTSGYDKASRFYASVNNGEVVSVLSEASCHDVLGGMGSHIQTLQLGGV